MKRAEKPGDLTAATSSAPDSRTGKPGARSPTDARYAPRLSAQLPAEGEPVRRQEPTSLEPVSQALDPFALHLLADEPSPVVQARAAGPREVDDATTRQIAAAGVEGPATRLPHADRIAASFGAKAPIVDGIRAHVGGTAAASAQAIGAAAYATGNDVAFASEPDLHTAAHEAAHVVQQARGVNLYGGVGTAGDGYERHADRVADEVVAGRSAERMLDELAPDSPAAPMTGAVQRTPDHGAQAGDSPPPGGSTPPAGEQQLVHGHEKWQVFARSGKPYMVEERDGTRGAWIVRDWVRAAPDLKINGENWVSPSRNREVLTAIGIDAERLDYAVAHWAMRFNREYQYEPIGAEGSLAVGLPAGKATMVERRGHGLFVAFVLDDRTIAPGTPHEPTDTELERAAHAAADFTHLDLDPEGLAYFLKLSREPTTATNGASSIELTQTLCRVLFGFDAFERWETGKITPREKSATPKLKLDNFYKQPIPGELIHYADIVESGESVRWEVRVDWPPGAPNDEIYDAPPMVTPSKFGVVALLTCNWRFERLAQAAPPPATPAPDPATPQPPAGAPPATTATNAGPATQPATDAPAADATAGAAAPSTPAATPSTPAPPTAAPPAMPAAAQAVETEATAWAESVHVFHLAPGEESATFLVTCDARFDEYFAPATFTRQVTVMSPGAAMGKLRAAEFADLGGDDAHRRGDSWASDLVPGFVPTQAIDAGAGVADPQALGRARQREQLESVRAYLADSPSNAATVEAIDRELERQDRTEKLLQGDLDKGWQPFQVRGTYLSRTEGLASGPLDLHGTVHREARQRRWGKDDYVIEEVFSVQIRDLSRRFEQNDFTFTGTGQSFDSALKSAFDDLAVAYPKGELAIEAEEIRDGAVKHADGSPGLSPGASPGTGKAIGFQRSTDTTWKKVKAAVWDPVVSVVVNLGAMAIMVLVPGSAVVVAPALIAYNTIPVVDHMKTEADRGTLTASTVAISVGEIALNLLPVLGEAKPFTAGWFAIETANWGGQVALMSANAIVEGKKLQNQQVAALATEYQQFLELQKHSLPSDPGLATAEATIRQHALDVQSTIAEQFAEQVKANGLVIVAGSVIHNTLPGVREALIEDLRVRVSGKGEPSSTSDPVAPPPAGTPPSEPPPSEPTGTPPSAPPATPPSAPAGDANNTHAKPPHERPTDRMPAVDPAVVDQHPTDHGRPDDAVPVHERKTDQMPAVDPDATTQGKPDETSGGGAPATDPAKVERAAHAKALEASVQKLPGAEKIEVVADDGTAPLAPNQVTIADAKKLVAMNVAAKQSEVGRAALQSISDLGISLTMQPGAGSYRKGNHVNIDPHVSMDPDVLAGILSHEMHHARTGDAAASLSMSREQYIEASIRNEAEAQGDLFEHFQEIGKQGDAQGQLGAREYFFAYDTAAAAYRKANPGATAAEVHAHAKQAGVDALPAVFRNATPSTSIGRDWKLLPDKPATYEEHYGQYYDRNVPSGTKPAKSPAPEAPIENVMPAPAPPPPNPHGSEPREPGDASIPKNEAHPPEPVPGAKSSDLQGRVPAKQLPAVLVLESQLNKAGRSADLELVIRAVELAAQGRIHGIDEFLADALTRPPEQVRDLASEAGEAARLANENPASIIRIGQDAATPGKSFDISVEDPHAGGATVQRRAEVFTIVDSVTRGRDLVAGAAHAASKFPKKVREGTQPRPAGEFAGTARVLDWPPQPTPSGGDGQRVVLPNGDILIRRPDVLDKPIGNVFQELVTELNTKRFENPAGYLNELNVVGGDGTLIARFVNNQPNDWTGAWVQVLPQP